MYLRAYVLKYYFKIRVYVLIFSFLKIHTLNNKYIIIYIIISI